MPKIRTFADFNPASDKFPTTVSNAVKSILDVANGKLEFDHNLNTNTVTVDFPTANTDVSVSHGLDKLTVNYFKCSSDVACHVFTGKQNPTNQVIYLQSDVAPATVTLILF